MHVLNTGQLVNAVRNAEIEGADELIESMVQIQQRLATQLARHYEITHVGTDDDMDEIGSSFAPSFEGQECPEHLYNYDPGSDWACDPDDVEPHRPMVVLYRMKGQPVADVPLALLCGARDSDDAELQCQAKAGPETEILWVVETDSATVAFDSYYKVGEARPEVADRLPPRPLVNDAIDLPFVIQDQESGFNDHSGSISILPHGISLRVSGFTDNASVDDLGELVVLTLNEGDLQLRAFADINQEEPTHTISFRDARNQGRAIL